MVTHRLVLNRPFFDEMQAGQKRYEGRCRWKAALTYAEGDIFKVYRYNEPESKESFTVRIVKIHAFKTFREALEKLPLKAVLPSAKSVDDGCETYRRFVSDKTAAEHGVLMLVALLKQNGTCMIEG
jgi:ASC-1-like (ASCH) protein